NISDNVSLSKRQIQRIVTEQLGGRIDVICTNSAFSYVVNTELFCESEKNNVTCLVFKQSSNFVTLTITPICSLETRKHNSARAAQHIYPIVRVVQQRDFVTLTITPICSLETRKHNSARAPQHIYPIVRVVQQSFRKIHFQYAKKENVKTFLWPFDMAEDWVLRRCPYKRGKQTVSTHQSETHKPLEMGVSGRAKKRNAPVVVFILECALTTA
uniref:Ground-like domain-containing protein n=1 Tax=Ascaris lumbricoides TaxID=6252 RepID=A0A0M3IBV6_ASCLU